jgi:RHS repeat-associated protein
VQIGLLETLLAAGASVNGAAVGSQPLIAALRNGRREAAEFLATRGAGLDLEGAAGVGDLRAVQSFFRADGTLRSPSTNIHMELGFLWACEYGRNNVVNYLLTKGIDPNRQANSGLTGLHWAVVGAQLATINLLLAHGASLEAKNVYGGTPLGQALWSAGKQAVRKYVVPLTAGVQVVYQAATPVAPTFWRHSDWLGSVRMASTTNQMTWGDQAYGPFGETYANTGATLKDFTGQTQDTASGIQDFLFRQYSSAQGRWEVPDPAGLAAVDITNPQTWNRYAYLANNPLNKVDPLGLYCFYRGQGDTPENDSDASDYDFSATGPEGCEQGGQWIETQTNVTVNGDTGEVTFTETGANKWGGDALGAFWLAYFDKIRAGRAALNAKPTPEQYIQAIANAAPTVCGGGAFAYAGAAGEVKSGALSGSEGFVGGLAEYDSNTGGSANVLVEAGGENLSGGVAVNKQGAQPLLFVPVAAAGGLVLFDSGVGVYAGTPNVGAGGYLNVTTNANCQQLRTHP